MSLQWKKLVGQSAFMSYNWTQFKRFFAFKVDISSIFCYGWHLYKKLSALQTSWHRQSVIRYMAILFFEAINFSIKSFVVHFALHLPDTNFIRFCHISQFIPMCLALLYLSHQKPERLEVWKWKFGYLSVPQKWLARKSKTPLV